MEEVIKLAPDSVSGTEGMESLRDSVNKALYSFLANDNNGFFRAVT